jgi:hypothetical protein
MAAMGRIGIPAVVALLSLIAGCDSRNDDLPSAGSSPPPVVTPPSPPPPPPPPRDPAPRPPAGGELATTTGQSVSLNGGASTDPDGDTLRYAWTIVAGSGGALSQVDQATAGFVASMPGTYIIEVAVRDPGNLSSTDIVVIDVRAPRSATAVTMNLLDTLVEGGAAAVALYLPGNAGAGGLQVTLTSSDLAVASVPASVVVPEGESVAAFNIDALAQGTATISASAAGVGPASFTAAIAPRVLDLASSSGANGVPVGQTATLTVRLANPAPAGGARVMLTLPGTTRATLSAALVDIPAGASEGTATLTAVQAGSVVVDAALAGSSAAEPLRLMIIPAGAADRPSAELIDAALAAGTITAEQAVVYGLQAAFGAADLPAQFRGNDTGRLDSVAPRLATLRAASLSDASQDAIGIYLFPPIYAASWGANITPSQRKASVSGTMRAADESCFDRLRGMPRSDTLPHWRFIRTGPFKIWYPSVLGNDVAQFNWYTAAENEAAALRVAATIADDFTRLGAVLGSVLRDGGITCNGGDDAIDVYVTRIGFSAKAQVMPYLPGECARPGWMWVAPDAVATAEDARNVIAHELVHLFQLRYARPNCDDWRYGILDEATATWALDFLYPRDNFEHEYLAGGPSYFNPAAGEWRASPLETGAGSVRNCNGYCDYLFFQWLSRRFSPSAVRGVLDATATVNAQRAYEVGLGGIGGGLENLWPRFALFQWNDWVEDVEDELHSWESVGPASIRRGVVPALAQTIAVRLDGERRREIGDSIVRSLRAIRDGELPAMTASYVHLRFDDPAVSLIRLEHLASVIQGQRPRFRLQALQKIDGTWRQAEDWTGERDVRWCRDRRDERLEELVLVYSNSDAGDEPFQHSGPSVVEPYGGSEPPRLTISNVACKPWHGTTRVTFTNSLGGVTRHEATVTYQVLLDEGRELDEVLLDTSWVLHPQSGIASTEMNWTDENGCRQTIPRTTALIGGDDSRLFVDAVQGSVPYGWGATNVPDVVVTFHCPGSPPSVMPPTIAAVPWLLLPANGAPLDPNSRVFRGSETIFVAAANQTMLMEWNLSAEREE